MSFSLAKISSVHNKAQGKSFRDATKIFRIFHLLENHKNFQFEDNKGMLSNCHTFPFKNISEIKMIKQLNVCFRGVWGILHLFFPTPSVFYTSRKWGVLHLVYPTPFFVFLEHFWVYKTLFQIFQGVKNTFFKIQCVKNTGVQKTLGVGNTI